MIYSIGHSTLSSEDLLAQLQKSSVTRFIDVRSHPTSRWEQHRKENLQVWLPDAGVSYEWMPELGGWDKQHSDLIEQMKPHGVDVGAYVKGKFPKQRIAINKEPDVNQEFLPIVKPSWTNVGLRDYSWFMTLPEFLEGVDRLLEKGMHENVAIVCCEAVPWRCHRSMVSDYLLTLGADVQHIFGNRVRPHSSMLGNRLQRYETDIQTAWDSWLRG